MNSMKPKVAIITPGTFPIPSPRSSSVETVVDQLSRTLSEEVRFYIYSKKIRRLSSYETRSGVTYIRPSFTSQAKYLKRVKLSIFKVKPHVIQVENRPRYVKYLRHVFPRTPIWISLHSTTFISAPHITADQLAACLSCANKVIVNSHFLRSYLLSILPWLGERTVVNHLGVNTKQIVPRWLEEQQRLHHHFKEALGYQDKKIILYLGRLVKIKGVHEVLEALPAIIERCPNVVFVIAGSAYYGSDRSSPYVQKLHRMGNTMPRHVRFVPYIPHNEIQAWLRIADIVVVPSAAEEAFGLVNLEAMAAGVPVIATNAGGLKEIVVHGTTGYLIDPKKMRCELSERIIHLMEDERQARTMGEAGFHRVHEQFTWQHTADRLLHHYMSLFS